MKRNSIAFLLLLLVAYSGFSQITQVSNPTPAVNIQYIGPEKGALMIVGGGKINQEIAGKFLELAGGPNANIVVIPTAAEDSSVTSNGARSKEWLEKLGAKQVTILHTRDPKVANTEAFIAPLKKATAVWLVGGRQWRLADSYLNTLTHKELQALLNRGGIIGGTSAGATIQGSFMVRGDTKGNTLMIGDHTEGLGFIRNVTIDQHLLRRNRQFDLVEVIRSKPELLGIGLDEGSAILVQQNTFKVLGDSYVAIYDAKQIEGKTKSPSGEYGTIGPFYYLQNGQQFDLQTRQVIKSSRQQ